MRLGVCLYARVVRAFDSRLDASCISPLPTFCRYRQKVGRTAGRERKKEKKITCGRKEPNKNRITTYHVNIA